MATEQTIISRVSSKGQAIEVRLTGDYPKVAAYVDGKPSGRGFTTFGRPQVIAGKSYVAAVGKVVLSQAEYDQICTAIKAAELATADGRLVALREQRRQLVTAVSVILDATGQAREQGADEDLGNISSYDSPEYRAAAQAVTDFDVAHPEVKVVIAVERKASVERHVWD